MTQEAHVGGGPDAERGAAPRRRRRAVGPPGARPSTAADLDVLAPEPTRPAPDDDERLRREVPPHHDDPHGD